ncbi:MAG: DCC1-like thiol-disulfide oxidoreductase family protein [Chitinophagaceae bacterium]
MQNTPIENMILLYDKDCPLCRAYSKKFVQYGMLAPEGRISFQEIDFNKFSYVNFAEAKNRVALVFPEQKKVQYGLDSIITVLSNRFPLLKKIVRLSFVYYFLQMLYAFISWNRKVFFASQCSTNSVCNPSKNWTWRIALVIVCALIVNWSAGYYFTTFLHDYFKADVLYSDLIFFGVQIVWQYIVCLLLKERNWYDYIAHLAIVSFLGALLLFVFSILLSIASIYIDCAFLSILLYGFVFGFMFWEHHRRVKRAGLHYFLTYSWILIRILMYPFAFKI